MFRHYSIRDFFRQMPNALLAPAWESKFRQRYEDEMINRYDTHFYVGTVHKFPASWIIVGLFYPPRPAMNDLFG
jgi:hypothetical protein